MTTYHREVAARPAAEIRELRRLSARRGEPWPLWASILIWMPAWVGLVLFVTKLPLSSEHWTVLGGVVLWTVHLWWLLDCLVTGVFTSKQGNYDRRKQPVRYWATCAFLGGMQLMMAVVAIMAWYGV